jgi:hypothetical protein
MDFAAQVLFKESGEGALKATSYIALAVSV